MCALKYAFKDNFKHLDVTTNNKNDRTRETDHKIQAGNRACCKCSSIMKSKEISRETKMRVYRVAIRPVVTYRTETMIVTNEEEKLRRFGRKIYGPKNVVEEVHQKLMNSEVQKRLQEENIVKAIKTQRLQWYDRIRRMGEENVVTEWRPDFRRAREDRKADGKNVLEDIKRLRVHNWSGKIQDRKSWKRIIKEMKTSIRIETKENVK